MTESFEGRVAWVVGASGAIGSATARMLASRGAKVMLSGRSLATLRVVADEIAVQGGFSEARAVDICSRADVDKVAGEIVDAYGRLDYLVNSTALGIFGNFDDLLDEQWYQVLDTKLLGYMRTMRAAIPYMRRQGGGGIVNISGRGGRQPTPAHLPGGCANAAVNLLTKGIADANVKFSIRANTVAPGPIESMRIDQIRESTQKISEDHGVWQSLQRSGQPEDVARVVVWLLSAEAGHITGAVLPVDGGGTATV